MGNWCYHLSKLREALNWFERAAELLPDAAIAYTCQGDIYKRQGRYELAERAYRTATRVQPEDEAARRKLLDLYGFRYGDPPD